MRTMPVWLVFVCRAILIVLLPIVLTLTNVRLLLTHAFPQIEYSLPGFPDDPFGLTKPDRIKWANLSMDYLLNNAGIEFVRAFRFPPGVTAPAESCVYYKDGDCNRFYNDRELQHMQDVKIVLRRVLNVWAVAGIMCLLAAGALFYFHETAALRAGLLGGAGVTLVILIAIVTYVLVDFNDFFVQFHGVFFAAGTWTFLFTDSFIRLFPEKFWEDAFTIIGAGAVVEALAIAAWAWWGLK
jgi:integral membrane protein (TIGR01906 family)